MGQNKKLFNKMREFEMRESNPINQYERVMHELAPPKQKETIKTIINTLKPKENGKRN
tara:strand:+ start:1594 stop:1767 length:174 start_codon:yes stop_codon:yes gene_type:complete